MATVQLSDIIDVVVFDDLPALNDPTLTLWVESGIVATGPFFDQKAQADGRTAEIIYWKDLDISGEPNYSSDAASNATPQKADQAAMTTRKAHLNNGWSAMDLARELQSGTDALQHIRNRTDNYWVQMWQKRVISATKDVFNNNVANDSSDMVNDIAVESIAGQSAATKFSRSAFITTAMTLGDHFNDLSVILVHSVVYQTMLNQDDIDFIRDADGRLTIPTYLGHRIVVDDSSPVVAGSTDGFKYTSVIFGQSAFGWGVGSPTVPVEVYRDPITGDGGGEEQLWLRKTWLLHPLGHDNDNGTATANNGQQNNADLTAANNWTRLYDRKNIPMAFLVTNA